VRPKSRLVSDYSTAWRLGRPAKPDVILSLAQMPITLKLFRWDLTGSNRKFKSQKAMIYKQLCELLKELSTSKLVGGECPERALAIVLGHSAQLWFFDFLKGVSSISDTPAFASEAGIGRSRHTTYLAEYLKAEYLLQMSEIKENPPKTPVIARHPERGWNPSTARRTSGNVAVAGPEAASPEAELTRPHPDYC